MAKQRSSNSGSFKSPWILHLIFILIAALFAFYGVIENGFTDWDDNLYVTDSELIKSLSSENIKRMFSELVASLYTPITILSYAIEYQIGGLDPGIYHGTNLFLHLISSLLVYFLIKKFNFNSLIALSVALIFAVHPLHSETVAWISSRKDLLFSLFYLAALLSYLNYRENKKLIYYTFCFLFFLLSIFSKPTALTFPFVLVLIDYFRDDVEWKKRLLEKVPMMLLSIGFFIFGLYLIQEVDVMEKAPEGYSVLHKIALAAYGIAFYIYSSVIPYSLSNFHSYPHLIDGSLDSIYWISPFFLIAFAALIYYLGKKNKQILFGALFFLFVIGPAIRFVPTAYPIAADRYFYLASVGLILVLVLILQFVLKSLKANSTNLMIIPIAVLCLLFAMKSRDRVKDWKNSITLWESALEDDPSLHLATTHLGKAYDEFGNKTRALLMYEKSLKENPDLPDILNSAGVIYFENQQLDIALKYYDRSLKNESNSVVFYNRGNVFKAKGEWSKSIEDYDLAIELDKNFAQAYNNRAVSKVLSGDSLGAFNDFKMAVELEPSNEMFNNNFQRIQSTVNP